MTDAGATVLGNVYDKYGTRNPIARAMMARFLRAFDAMLDGVAWRSALEVGAGEGRLAERLRASARAGATIAACDLSAQVFDRNALRRAGADACVADAGALPVQSGAVELVVACEVLEHLHEPRAAVDELWRVTRKWALCSVPREPLWRALNVARGAYVRDLGNTPGHVQHWSRDGFERLVSRRFRVARLATPVPWTMALLERREEVR